MAVEIKPYIRKANFYETDQMGIIHHSNYIRWFEEARVDFMEQMGYGYEVSVEKGVDFALIEIGCEYKSMVRFNDIIAIETVITELGNTKMKITYKIVNVKTNALCAEGFSRHCYYDSIKKRPVSLKKAIPELYSLFAEMTSI